jgi:hypothetical protein
MSFVPPGVKGMMIRIGLVGNCWAWAAPVVRRVREVKARIRGRRFMGVPERKRSILNLDVVRCSRCFESEPR